MEPIRVLHNIVLMDPGGIETLVMNLYRHIDREKLLFDFLVHRPQEGFYEKEIQNYGGKIYRTQPFHPLKTKEFEKECMKIFSEHPEYEVFHAHQELNLWTLKYAKKAGISTRIAHSHNAKTVLNLKYFFLRYEQMFIKEYCTDMFMCSTPAGEWSYGKKAVADGQVRLIKNGIETERFQYNKKIRSEVRKELKLEGKTVIGHVGRFMQQKNHDFLLEIFQIIHKKNPNTVLVLCGEGRLEENIRKKANELKISDSVKFLGVRKDTDRIYQAYDLFLFPSLWEGLPLTGIEAQTAGLPILMSDVIAPETIVTDNVTTYSLRNTAEQWADQALKILGSYKRTDCRNQVVKAGFDIRETAEWLQEFYIERTMSARKK